MIFSFLKRYIIKAGAFAALLQALSWLFGQDQFVLNLLKEHWWVTAAALVLYGFWDYVIYDAPRALAKAKYENKIKNAKRKCRKRT